LIKRKRRHEESSIHSLPETKRHAENESEWTRRLTRQTFREIAKDNTRAFFVSFEKNLIVAPYDGGVDCVRKDSLTRNVYKINTGNRCRNVTMNF
jgi:hypothetical protein